MKNSLTLADIARLRCEVAELAPRGGTLIITYIKTQMALLDLAEAHIVVHGDRAAEPLAEQVDDMFGPRCPDFDSACSTCQAWARYDAARPPVNEGE